MYFANIENCNAPAIFQLDTCLLNEEQVRKHFYGVLHREVHIYYYSAMLLFSNNQVIYSNETGSNCEK